MVGLTQAMNIRAQAADVGGSSPPVAPTYLLFLWALIAGSIPASLRRRLHLSREDVLLGYCAAMISGPITHQFGMGFLIPHMVAPYYFDSGWVRFYEWLPEWFGPRDPAAVRVFFIGRDGTVPWGAWLVSGLAWTILLGALFLTGHCGMILVRRQWIESERLSFPLAQIPLALATDGRQGLPAVVRSPMFWIGLAIPMVVGALNGIHRYSPSAPSVPLRPMVEYDFGTTASRPWTGLGTLEFRLSLWLVGIVALLPAEISFSGWVFFWITKLEDISAVYFGATQLPSVYSNEYPALYSQGAGAAFALAGLTLWGSRRHLGRMFRAAFSGRSEPYADEFASPRFAVLGFLFGLGVILAWFCLAGMRWWVAALFVGLMLGYFLIFARIRGETGLGMGVILWPKMLDEVMLTLLGSRGLLPAELTVLYATRWLYFGPPIGGVIACQLESFKVAGDAGIRGRAAGRVLLLAALVAIPIAFVWTLHTFHAKGFLGMPISHRGLSMVGRQIYWSYANLVQALDNPEATNWQGVTAMGVGGSVAMILAALRSRFLWWPLHPIGYMAANSWGMHWNWGSLTVGWLIKVILLRYGGLRLFRQAVPLFIGLVVGDMLSEGIWGSIAAWLALTPG